MSANPGGIWERALPAGLGRPCGALCVCVLLASPAAAAEAPMAAGADDVPELVTDRPDQTESAETVPRGAVQVEIGAARSEDSAGDDTLRGEEIGSALVRVGLAESWELRLGWGGWVDAPEARGAADADVGFKWRFARSASGATTAALLASTSLPVGGSEVSGERSDPQLRVSVAHDLSERLSFGWNVGVAVVTERDAAGDLRSPTTMLATAALGFAATPRVGLFVELFGEGGGSRGGSPATAVDGGVTYRLRPNAQLDLSAGFGLSRAAPKRFVGVGFSCRFPR